MRFLNKIIYISLICLCVTSCKINFGAVSAEYSTSGASISPETKTYSIDYFPNKALLVVTYLSSKFSDELKKYIKQKTGLNEITNNNGQVRFEGQITGYENKPMDIKQNEVAASNRLTITIRVKYTNTLDDKFDFDQSFSNYADYSTDADFNSIEEALIEEIIQKIIEDIYTKAFVNW